MKTYLNETLMPKSHLGKDIRGIYNQDIQKQNKSSMSRKLKC